MRKLSILTRWLATQVTDPVNLENGQLGSKLGLTSVGKWFGSIIDQEFEKWKFSENLLSYGFCGVWTWEFG